MVVRGLIISGLFAASVSAVAVSAAQQPSPPPVPVRPDSTIVANLPFGQGERMTYAVTLSPFGKVGEGSIGVEGIDTVRGVRSYRLRMQIKGGIVFAHVDDTFESWVNATDFSSLRFRQRQKEVNYKRNRTLDFYPDQMRWVGTDGKSGELGSDRPLDDVSFLYFARTLPLEVGRTYTLNRYFAPDGNPVTLKVLRRETVTVPAGVFNTIVVQPVIRTKGLFAEGGKAEVFFTDDDQRLLVQLKSDVPVLGSLNLKLTGYTPGERPSEFTVNH